MSVGSVGKWLSLGLLVTALGAVGCGDDDPKEVEDSGTGDGGSMGGGDDGGSAGGMDAGKDGGGGTGGGDAGGDSAAANSCPDNPGKDNACCNVKGATTLCTFHPTQLGNTKAGCALSEVDAEVCGISSANVLMGKEPLFLEKDAPGVVSQACADFYDVRETIPDGGVDAGLKGNGFIDTQRDIMGFKIALQYPGCCTVSGKCSINGKMAKANSGTGYNPADTGYGCMRADVVFAGTPSVPCNPMDGAILLPPPSDAGAGDAGASDASADAAGG